MGIDKVCTEYDLIGYNMYNECSTIMSIYSDNSYVESFENVKTPLAPLKISINVYIYT
jgi:hypothetical protein